MQPTSNCSAPACWWQMWASGLLCWYLWLGTYSVGFLSFFLSFFFSPSYTSPWDSKTPHRLAGERVSWYLETSPPSRFHPQDGFPSLTLLSLFLCFIFSPTSFPREWAAFLGAWCPPPAFRSCSVEVSQHSNDLLLNLWGRKRSPHPIPLPFRTAPHPWISPDRREKTEMKYI